MLRFSVRRLGEWRKENPELKGNMHDHATLHQLLVLANMESYNAAFITEGLPQSERLNNTSRDSGA
ncbi:MAG: hypothetical protein LBP79_06700 [Clostridiales bacterium]|nr:hypothetical protein [Clostridiales bacterium]